LAFLGKLPRSLSLSIRYAVYLIYKMSIRYAVCLIYKICQKLISRILSVSCFLKYKNILLIGIRSVYFPNLGSLKRGGGAVTDSPHRPLATSLLFWVSYIESAMSHHVSVRRHTALHVSLQLRLRFPRSLVRIFEIFYVFIIFLGLIRAYVPPASLYQGKWTQSLKLLLLLRSSYFQILRILSTLLSDTLNLFRSHTKRRQVKRWRCHGA
jgi:hypothetical protein